MNKLIANKEYKDFLIQVKTQIRSSQAKAALAVNSSLIYLYWNLGKLIAEKQEAYSWGNSVIETLSGDLKSEFPDSSGFSSRNLFNIRRFYLFYNNEKVRQAAAQLNLPKVLQLAAQINQQSIDANTNLSKVQQVVAQINDSDTDIPKVLQLVAQIPWGHQLIILDKIKDPIEALFYMQQTIEYSWTRAVLGIQMEQNLYARQGKAINNFKKTLSEQQAIIAQEILKDPYNFEFLTLEPNVQELEMEKFLTEHITKFLLELGKGFAFLGRQYPIKIGNKSYNIDLLFYHIRLHCYVVIELKTKEFEPEFAGKLNFYLSAVDDLLRTETDQSSIGILLCKNKDKIEVEYSLRDINKPIGVSEFTFTEALPNKLKSSIPTVEEFENELNKLSEVTIS